MAEATEGGEAGRPLSPSRPKDYARDLLRRFSGTLCPEEWRAGGSKAEEEEEEEVSGEMELSLGLSLGGCFGVDPGQKRGVLVRSSSLASLPFPQRGGEQEDPAAASPAIARTCSLPVETEEEQRKRKELQCLRRMEAKRKRSEKRNGCARPGGRDRSSAPPEEGHEHAVRAGKGGRGACPPRNGVTAAAWAAARGPEGTGGFPPASQGPVGSQGSCSSGLSDLDTGPLTRQGSGVVGLGGSGTKTRTQSSIQQLPNVAHSVAAIGHGSSTVGRPTSHALTEAEDSSKEVAAAGGNVTSHMMQEMPCVSTRGGGPDGRRVEGFLYPFKKGEEVRIVCVCHGSFFSPAEFVKHAGGGEVAHPLRHIVVSPSPPSFL